MSTEILWQFIALSRRNCVQIVIADHHIQEVQVSVAALPLYIFSKFRQKTNENHIEDIQKTFFPSRPWIE